MDAIDQALATIAAAIADPAAHGLIAADLDDLRRDEEMLRGCRQVDDRMRETWARLGMGH